MWNESKISDLSCPIGFPLAEPQGFFSNPGTLVQSLNSFKEKNGDLIFYDSVCGLPVFRVIALNINRFLNETNVFGWPSFRSVDFIKDNIIKVCKLNERKVERKDDIIKLWEK